MTYQDDEKYLHAPGDSNDIHDEGVPDLINLYPLITENHQNKTMQECGETAQTSQYQSLISGFVFLY